jgi:hypothetical protein
MAVEDIELVSLGVDAQPGAMATSPLSERASHAGYSFNKPDAGMAEDGSCEG